MKYQKVMNNTKWEEIRLAMQFPTNRKWRIKVFKSDTYCNDWWFYFRIGMYDCIEWFEIKAETEEIRNEVLEILKSIHVPGEVLDDVIRVYGYVEIGTSIDYL